MIDVRSLSIATGLCLTVIISGCGKSEPSNGDGGEPAPIAGPGGGPPGTSGNAVFDRNCAKCHSVGGAGAIAPGGPKGKKGAPNLSKVGADPAHTVEWLADYIKDPTTQKPDSKMPKFENKLKPEEIRNVAEFLSELK